MLLSQPEEPEVYLLSRAILEAENTLLDQSDRSTQIVLSIGPICLGLCTFVIILSTPQTRMAADVYLVDLVLNKSYSFRLSQGILN